MAAWMFIDVNKYRYTSRRKQKKRWLIIPAAALLPALILLGRQLGLGERITSLLSRNRTQVSSVAELWNNRAYDEIIARCEETLSADPMDATALMYKGFSSFYKVVSGMDLEDNIPILEDAIVALRRAKLDETKRWAPETDYILGKAYFYKGQYYYDLAIRYLEQALASGYMGEDIYDFLGLAYTRLGMLGKGLDYFLKAIEINPTDLLLLTVGQNYFEMGQRADAEEYLIRTVNKTDDQAVEMKSRFLLGQLYYERADYFKAEKEYRQIIEMNPQSADAHFYLGEIYARINDPVKARAEWRKTLIIDPSHYGARLRYYR